jgi:serine phosphatase RsbU (regulator of sigma subunit)
MLFVLLGTALLVDGLSRSAETARQRTREMALLEVLSQTVLQSPLDGSALPDLLAEHIPGLFPLCDVAICLYPDQMLMTHPGGWAGSDPLMWAWEADHTLPQVFEPRHPRPWVTSPARCGTLIVPIVEAQGERAIGRMVIERATQGRHLARLLPAAQSLAAQIASALYSADAYQKSVEERIARERGERELALGARVQTSFLPREVPVMDGWQIAAELEPARETSGDFYDFIPLQGGRLGIVVADVADKGLGAAFHMALGVTLMRSTLAEIASRYPRSTLRQMPELVRRVNARLIGDSTTETFITAFFGILDTKTSTLHYINAGHNPPYVFRPDRRRRIRELRPTGPALGLFDEYRWGRRSVKLHPGDLIVLYTDGLTDAEDSARNPFGEGRLQNVVRDNLGQPVTRLADAVMGSVYDFRGEAAQFDDITLVLVRREG